MRSSLLLAPLLRGPSQPDPHSNSVVASSSWLLFPPAELGPFPPTPLSVTRATLFIRTCRCLTRRRFSMAFRRLLGQERALLTLPPLLTLHIWMSLDVAYSLPWLHMPLHMLLPLSRALFSNGNSCIFFKTECCCHLQSIHPDFSPFVLLVCAGLPTHETHHAGFWLSVFLTVSAHLIPSSLRTKTVSFSSPLSHGIQSRQPVNGWSLKAGNIYEEMSHI